MNSEFLLNPRLDEMLQKLFDQTLSPSETQELQSLLKASRAARARYLLWVELHGSLRWAHIDLGPAQMPIELEAHRSDGLMRKIRLPNLNASRAAALLILALVAGAVLTHWLRRPAIIWVVASAGGEQESLIRFSAGSFPAVGRPQSIGDCSVELGFPSGSRAVIQGPAEFSIESPTKLQLLSGKLSARVSGGNFQVETPVGTVTDLGTEFGIELQRGGPLKVDVFKGRVQVTPPSNSAAATDQWSGRELTEGASLTVTNGRVEFNSSGACKQAFVREVDPSVTRLDIVDLINGGDGSTRLEGVSIDPTTGSVLKGSDRDLTFKGDGRFHLVSGIPVVDGCFIPEARPGGMVVDTANHRFAFRKTSGTAFNFISAGGNPGHDLSTGNLISAKLGNVDYASPGHVPLYMHSNKGLTLNLDVIRRLHPGMQPYRFSCAFGNSYPGKVSVSKLSPMADLYVLVDGQNRFERREFFHGDGPVPLEVPLSTVDHCLTIVSADGGDDIKDDWVLLGDPAIDLAPR